MKKHSLCLLFCFLTTFLGAQAVQFDSAFGSSGVVLSGLSNSDSYPFGVCMNLHSDGKLSIAGERFDSLLGRDSVCLEWYDQNGVPCAPFFTPTRLRGYKYATALQQDGKLILCGPNPVAPFRTEVLRLRADGQPDSTFGQNGYAPTGVRHSLWAQLFEQTDGKIVVFGSVYTTNGKDTLIVTRLNPDGSLDSSFAQNGHFLRRVTDDGDAFLHAGLQQPDGKLLFTGTSDNFLLLLRLNSDGTMDPTFGANGLLADKTLPSSWGFGIALQPDGKIVVTGFEDYLGSGIIARYHPDGSKDLDFAAKGVEYFQDGYDGVGIVVLPNGKILTALRGFEGSEELVALAQLLPNGERDLSFGVAGFYRSSLRHKVRNLILDGERLYVSAQGKNSQGRGFNSIIRFLLDLNVGTLDPDNPSAPALLMYPNPISEHFTLEFGLVKPEQVSIHLFDLQGKLIQSFVQNQSFEPGEHRLTLSCPGHLPSGNYVLSLEVAGKKMTSVQVMKK